MNSKRLIVVLTALLVALTVGMAHAQPPMGGRGFGAGGNTHHEKMRMMIGWKLVEYLDLDEETSVAMYALYNDFLDESEKHREEYRELVQEIDKNLDDESVSTDTIREQIEKLDQMKGRRLEQRNEFAEQAKDILTERQYLKLLVFEDVLRERMVGRMKRGGGGFGGMGLDDPPPPPGE